MRKTVIDKVFKNLKILVIFIILGFILGCISNDSSTTISTQTSEKSQIEIKVDIDPENPIITDGYSYQMKITVKNTGTISFKNLYVRFETLNPNFYMYNCGERVVDNNTGKELVIYKCAFKEGESWDVNDSEYQVFKYHVNIEPYYREAKFILNLKILHENKVIYNKDITITVKSESG